MKAVILAGGKGRRLLPYTTNFPKPLMPIGERPILEILLRQLKQSGIEDIIIATGYLEELIRAYFQDGERLRMKIRYSKEEEPLGTAGPLDLVRAELKDTFLMMNGDVLTDLSFQNLIEYHRSQEAVATVAVCRRTVHIDFGVVRFSEESALCGWDEKPEIEYYVSTGIYVFDSQALELLPSKEFLNLPDFIMKLRHAKKKVVAYRHKGYWLDIGRPEDYEKACLESDKLVEGIS